MADSFELKGRAPQWLLMCAVGTVCTGVGVGGRELAGSSFRDAVAQVADAKTSEVEKRMQAKAEQQLEAAKAQVLKEAAEQGAKQLQTHKEWLTEKFGRLDERFDRIDQRLGRIEAPAPAPRRAR